MLRKYLFLLASVLLAGIFSSGANAGHFLFSGWHGVDQAGPLVGGHTYTNIPKTDAGLSGALNGDYGPFDAIVWAETYCGVGCVSASTQAAIAAYVAGGGRFIIAGDHGSANNDLMNAVFGYSTTRSYDCTWSFNAPGPGVLQTTGTDFDNGPLTVPDASCTTVLDSASIPASATVIYASAPGVYEFVDNVGSGTVGYMGWDFCCEPGNWFAAFDLLLTADLITDSDGDGVPDDDDEFPGSDISPTVVIDGVDSGVPNTTFSSGFTLADIITLVSDACADGAKNHGKYVSCMAKELNSLKKAGVITGDEKEALQSAAAETSIGK